MPCMCGHAVVLDINVCDHTNVCVCVCVCVCEINVLL